MKSLLQREGCKGCGVVSFDQLLKTRDDLVVWHSQGVDVQTQHAGDDSTEVKELET